MEAKLKIRNLRRALYIVGIFFTFNSLIESQAWVGTRMRKMQSGVTLDATAPSVNGSAGTGVSSLTWNHTASGSNRFLLVAVAVGAMPDTGLSTAVTYNGSNLTSLRKVRSNDVTNGFIELFYLLAPPVGTYAVNVTITGGTADLEAGSISFNNVNQSSPIGYLNSDFGNGTTASLSIPSGRGHMVVDAISSGSTINSSTKSLSFLNNQNNITGAGNAAMSYSTGASNVTMAYNVVNDGWGLIALDLLPTWDTLPPSTTLAFSTGPQTLYSWECSSAIAVTSAPGPVTANLTVNLTGDSGVEFYSDSDCLNSVTNVTIPAYNTQSPNFYFRVTAPLGGTNAKNINAAAGGYTTITQTETIYLADKTWIGGASCDGNWTSNACWQSGSPPGYGDVVHFDGTCTVNCSPIVNSNIGLSWLWLHSNYAGTITQGTSTVTIQEGYAQEGGSFQGGSAGIFIGSGGWNTFFVVRGGTFNSTSGNLISNALVLDAYMEVAAPGVFNPGTGTVFFTPTNRWGFHHTLTNVNFNHVVFAGTNGGHIFTYGPVNVAGNMTVSNDINTWFVACDATAEFRVSGNVTANSGGYDRMSMCSNNYTQLSLVGSGAQNLSASANALPGGININQGVGGSVNLSGTISAAWWKYTAGTVNAGTSTVHITMNDWVTPYRLDSGSMHFNHLTVSQPTGSTWIGVPPASTTHVDGNLTINIAIGKMYDPTYTAKISVAGNILWSASDGNHLGLIAVGGNSQTYDGNVDFGYTNVTINKTAGSTFTLNHRLNAGTTNIQSGTVNLNTFIWAASGSALTVTGANSIINCNGDCGAGTACGQGNNNLRCATLDVNSGGSIVP